MKLQQLYSLTRQAVDRYHLIGQGDHIAVGVSGGKDSLALLYALQGLSGFYPEKFSISAITVDLGFHGFNPSPVRDLCRQLGIPYYLVSTRIGDIVFTARKESSPCSLCARMRKGALNQKALELGCNKVAYAHHRDDIIETMMLSLLYEGRFYAFPPYTRLDQSGLAVIRPLMLVPEADITGFKNRYHLPVCKNPCPADGNTRRAYVKELVQNLEKENHGVKTRLFHAVLEGNIPGYHDFKSPAAMELSKETLMSAMQTPP